MTLVWPRIIKCCSRLCDASRAKENWQKQYGTIPKSLCTCFLAWSITGTSALMGTWPQLESFYFNNLIDHNSLVHKRSDYDIPNHILCWIADFLMDRRQRVKLAQDCFCYIPAGFPQWTKLGPTCTWLFLIMIIDLNAREADIWKNVDDTPCTTTSEVIHQLVDDLARQARDERFQVKERKCEELRISFARNEPEFEPICVNSQTLETVNTVKSLGLNISSDWKWNVLVSELVRKVSTRLYFLRQLKKSHVATRELILFYITCVCSSLE